MYVLAQPTFGEIDYVRGLSNALEGIQQEPFFSELPEGARLYTTGISAVLESSTNLTLDKLEQLPHVAASALRDALNGQLDFMLEDYPALALGIQGGVAAVTAALSSVAPGAGLAGAAVLAVANAIVAAATAEKIRSETKAAAYNTCLNQVKNACMAKIKEWLPPSADPNGRLVGTGANGAIMPADLFRMWVPVYKHADASGFLQSFYVYTVTKQEAPPALATFYHVLCGGETFPYTGFFHPEEYNMLLSEAHAYNPNIGISLNVRRRMAKLIRGIVMSVQPVGTHPETDNGRSLFPILNAILINELHKGTWDEPFVRFLFDRMVWEQIRATASAPLPWYFAEGDPVAACNCRELLDYGSTPGDREFLAKAFYNSVKSQEGALAPLVEEIKKQEIVEASPKTFVLTSRNYALSVATVSSKEQEKIIKATAPPARHTIVKKSRPAWREVGDTAVGTAGVVAAGYLSYLGVRKWGPRK
jgi:hypothetical protein